MADTPEAVELRGFGLANYRSFGSEGFVLKNQTKINVIIGKNNSGKSNVLRALDILRRVNNPKMHLADSDDLVNKHRQGEHPLLGIVRLRAESIFGEQVPGPTNEWLKDYKKRAGDEIEVRWNIRTGSIDGRHPLDVFDHQQMPNLHTQLTSRRFDNHRLLPKERYLQDTEIFLVTKAVQSLRNLDRLIAIPVFRQIGPAREGTLAGEAFDGHGIIAKLRENQVPEFGRDKEREIFDKVEQFTADLLGMPDLHLQVPTKDQLLIPMHGLRMPLESHGTGIHHLVILCSALAMHDGYVVTIEEPEVHLHPELQRKFLRFISEQTNNTYFITTHSNVFLDLREDVSIYHVRHDGDHSIVEHASTTALTRAILDDMSYRASDLFQCNGIIWVEGPSDRVYLNRWLALVDPTLVEGVHYSILFYGSWPILTHFSCKGEPVDDLVQVMKINKNAVVIMDRDGDDAAAALVASKARILDELGPDSCWVTRGREIENYLPRKLLERYLSNRHSGPITVDFDCDDHLEDVIEAATKSAKGKKVRYKEAKVVFAREFCEQMTANDLDVHDLIDRLAGLIEHIRRWNHIDPVVAP